MGTVYTKKGDKGMTSFIDGKRVVKGDVRAWVVGSFDEVNSWLGVIISECEDVGLRSVLRDVQRDLFIVNSILVGAKLRFGKSKTIKLERKIDKIEKKLPKLTNFILPGGSRLSAKLHYGRVLVRRAERHLVLLNEEEKVSSLILMYVNRLSDFMFVLAREANLRSGVLEEVWKTWEG